MIPAAECDGICYLKKVDPQRARSFDGLKMKDKQEPHWIERKDNRFGVRILDCRSIVAETTAWTSNDQIAASFNRLRDSRGVEYVGQRPEDEVAVETNLRFSYDGSHDDGPVYKAEVMEDKWDMYLYKDRLYISRSWTGQLCFVADCRFKRDQVKIHRITTRRDCTENQPVYVERVVDFLVKSHQSNMMVPHPFPESKREASPEDLALYSFSVFGRRGLFGTFEETRAIRGRQPDANDAKPQRTKQ